MHDDDFPCVSLDIIENQNANLFAVLMPDWQAILFEDGSPKEDFIIKKPIGAWIIVQDDYGLRLVPLPANGQPMENDSFFYIFDATTEAWAGREFSCHGTGLESLKHNIIINAESRRQWELQLQDQDNRNNPDKVFHLRKPGGGK